MDYNLKIKNNDKSSYLIKVTQQNENTLEYANKILNNFFVLNPNLDIIDFTNEINWDYTHHTGPNTYKLYLHSFHPVSTLCNAFELTGNKVYLSKAIDITLDWNQFQLHNEHYFTWYDHSTASRTLVLTNLYLLLTNNNINNSIDTIKEILINNISFLYSDKAYRKNNHGIMMDRALIQAGMIFEITPLKPYVEKGLLRIQDNFYHSFSRNGTHLENSPEYHKVVRDLFLDVEKFLQSHNLTLGEDIIQLLNHSHLYYEYISKPDGFLPLLGDTKKMKSPTKQKRYDSFIDVDAGIAISQDLNKTNPKNSTWISFIAGYSTLTHKHYDDLSFTLFHNGDDIFIDSGKHSYGGSTIRRYIRSIAAHNTIGINNKNYSLLDPLDAINKICITDFTSNYLYDFIKGINLGYKDVTITRSLVHIKSDTILVLDKISGIKENVISQTFNLAPEVTIINKDKNCTVLKSNNTTIKIEQLNGTSKLNIKTGNVEKPEAIISEKYGKTINITQLEYMKKSKQDFFLTAITLNETSKVENIQFNELTNLLSFEFNSLPINIIV